MCDTCDPFFLPIPIGSDSSYRQQIEHVRSAVANEVLEIVDGHLPASDASADRCIRLTATCTRCGQLFMLERGGCHIFGDQWRPLHGN